MCRLEHPDTECGLVAIERHCLAVDLLDERDRLSGQQRAVRDRIRAAVAAASGTMLADIFGVGEVLAATIIGHTADIARYRSRPVADFSLGGRSPLST